MVCSCCRKVLELKKDYTLISNERDGEGTLIPHHRDGESLTASVDAGCYICNRLWAALDIEERCKVRRSVGELAKWGGPATKSPLTSVFWDGGAAFAYPRAFLLHLAFDRGKILDLGRNQRKGFFSLTVLLLPQESYAPQYQIKSYSRSTRSEETFRVAQKWITECLAEHPHCGAKPHASTTAQWYPSRLLDTGPLDQESSICRLVLPNVTPIQGSYATLSHCWGMKESFNLTTSNYAQLQQEIPFETLPPLYRDAVETSRRLHIRYLWIDSLCIIQHGDNFTDWKQESTHMDKIYSGSFVNISAADAPDANHPLFHDRNPDALYSQTIELPVSSLTTRFILMDYNFWRTEVSSAVINTRAWVLQERLLSPRVLYFGQRQILWECQQKEDAEIYPEGLLIDLSRFPSPFKGFGHNQIGWKPRDHGDLSKYQYWCNIVNAYTRAKLTFPVDKLIALSAVAKTVRELLQDSYVAGMWRRYLERELMWSVAVGEAQARPSVYRAPSWSWAAVDGHITPGIMDLEAVEILIEVQDLHLDYITSDTTGLISGGWLQLWGSLKKLELLPDAFFSSHSNDFEFLMMVVNGVPVSVRADSVMKEYQPHVYLDDNQQWESTQNHQQELFCMPARTRPGNDGSIYVLLLQLEDGKNGTFRRIGIARGWGKEVRESLLACNAEESTLPCVRYEGGRHLVRIV
ncbi:heterokaryon incompatibility protein [Colletotrichum acutatum]|uniref:Heterokaryon incompatibility protein n=1 Tax=Glomerella acutata TaxID=27357 RepID=A0AAD8UCK5_GLOAC|nr:heterokaryon incompatibility protein [Colletotrichum acutatum]KAK1711538.1 heterokaryon incompatibility protein [Colletotrichum acutatum]